MSLTLLPAVTVRERTSTSTTITHRDAGDDWVREIDTEEEAGDLWLHVCVQGDHGEVSERQVVFIPAAMREALSAAIARTAIRSAA